MENKVYILKGQDREIIAVTRTQEEALRIAKLHTRKGYGTYCNAYPVVEVPEDEDETEPEKYYLYNAEFEVVTDPTTLNIKYIKNLGQLLASNTQDKPYASCHENISIFDERGDKPKETHTVTLIFTSKQDYSSLDFIEAAKLIIKKTEEITNGRLKLRMPPHFDL